MAIPLSNSDFKRMNDVNCVIYPLNVSHIIVELLTVPYFVRVIFHNQILSQPYNPQ